VATSPADPVESADGSYDVAVLGAGPAGLAATVAARRAGARVALVDAAPRVGGQFWRHRDGDGAGAHHHWPLLQRLRAAVAGPDQLTGHSVWHVERTGTGFTLHATTTVDDAEVAREITCRALVIATGAHDRQLPFPGWTLPGVYTAGGAQALLKGHGVVVGRRIAVAGTGPFLLPVAAGLAAAGAQVVGVFEAGSPAGYVRDPAALLRNLDKLAEGAGYAATLLRRRVPVRVRTAVVAAHGDGAGVHAVTVARVDAGGNVLPGTERRVACDALAVGYGFTPQLEIPLQLGCATRLDGDGSLVAVADDQQRSSAPGVYLAGEVCGVGGAPLALVEGQLAGLYAAGARVDTRVAARLRHRRQRLRAFAAALHRAHPVPPGWTGWVTGSTTVCRCEEVTVSAVRAAVTELGATDPRTVKLLARPGMGLCQGRVCGHATASLVAQQCGRPVTERDLLGIAARPIARPVTLGSVAAGSTEHEPAGLADIPEDR
jgi:NADPH-dependent 2,4-dienoyl-CoA reductase/sulfur reductase-like enzyme